MPDLLRRKIPVRLVAAGATLAAVGVLLLVLGIVMMNRVTSNVLANIHANGVVTQSVVAAQIERAKEGERLTLDYHVDGRPFEGNIHCYSNVPCEPVGTQLTITADRRDPDEFVTADGRLVIDPTPSAWVLLVFVGIIFGAGGLGFLEYLRQRRHPGPPPRARYLAQRGNPGPPPRARYLAQRGNPPPLDVWPQAQEGRRRLGLPPVPPRQAGDFRDSTTGRRGTAGQRGPRSRP